MNYRFYITALSSRVEVFPLNFRSTSLVDAREKDKIYYRRSFSGSLIFTDNNGGDDFSLFYLIEATSPCERLILEIEQKDSGADTYHEYWTGWFSTTDGEFDLDRCTFTITPKVYDDYMEFDNKGAEEVNILDVPTVVTTSCGAEIYTRNRWLIDVIEFLADNIIPGVAVVSSFFNDATNYVTGIASRVNLITVAQKSDIKRPTSSNPATAANTTWNDFMNILKTMFNVYWIYDGVNVIVEHYSYFSKTAGLDLQTQAIAVKSNKYSYDKPEMPKYEKFLWAEASNIAFVGVPIWYDSPCVSSKTREYTVPVTTDIEMIQANTFTIADEGFVFLANYYDGPALRVWFADSKYGTYFKYNMDLSWANLQDAFHRHGRVLEEGYMNGRLTKFASIIPTKQQEINAIVCYDDNYDPNDLITTELGETYFDGEKGVVKSATIKPDGEVRFTLLYGETNTSGETTPPDFTLWIVEDLALYNNSYVHCYLNQPAPFDMTFWIWIEETNCQEYVIPEGELSHSELINATVGMDPIEYGDLKYNLLSASLDGVAIKYSGEGCAYPNDPLFPIIQITDAECGDAGSEPPPPALPTVVVSVKAGETWYIDNHSGTISIGSTSLSFTFKPHDCSTPRSHPVYIKVQRNLADDAWDEVYCKENYQCNKTVTVTAAVAGDVYNVILSEEEW